MSFEHIDSFVKAAHSVIESMLAPDIEVGKPYFNNEPLEQYDIRVLVGVLGDLHGQVICGMSSETAKKIASQMLFTDVQEIDEISVSALCELKNIIVGNASTYLSTTGFRCNITPPLFLNGADIPEFLRHIHTALAIPIQTPFGPVDINLALRKDELSNREFDH